MGMLTMMMMMVVTMVTTLLASKVNICNMLAIGPSVGPRQGQGLSAVDLVMSCWGVSGVWHLSSGRVLPGRAVPSRVSHQSLRPSGAQSTIPWYPGVSSLVPISLGC